jgi:hypothetical protein
MRQQSDEGAELYQLGSCGGSFEIPLQVHDNRRPSPEDPQPSGPHSIRAESTASVVVAVVFQSYSGLVHARVVEPIRHARRLAVYHKVKIIRGHRRREWTERHSCRQVPP